MNHKFLEDFILAKPGSWLDYPFGEDTAVYKVGSKKTAKMFALIKNGSDPAVISLKCPPELAVQLREEYETVMPGYHLNKKLWNTILATGQLDEDKLFSLIDLSYNLVIEGLAEEERGLLGQD